MTNFTASFSFLFVIRSKLSTKKPLNFNKASGEKDLADLFFSLSLSHTLAVNTVTSPEVRSWSPGQKHLTSRLTADSSWRGSYTKEHGDKGVEGEPEDSRVTVTLRSTCRSPEQEVTTIYTKKPSQSNQHNTRVATHTHTHTKCSSL